MKSESFQSDVNKERSSQKEDLFFDYPLHSIWKKSGKSVYSDEWGQLAYERVGSTCVVAGDPAGKTLKNRAITFENFRGWAGEQGLSVCGYYFSEEFSRAVPMNRHQAGVSLFLDLKNWSIEGGASEEARRALRKGDGKKLSVVEVLPECLDEWESALLRFSRQWRGSKGFFQIRFLLTPLSRSLQSLKNGERLFVCIRDGELDAVVSVVPWGDGSWYVDQLMQHPDGDRFALDYLVVRVIQTLKSERGRILSLGFCPGVIPRCHTMVEKILKTWGQMKIFYSPRGLYNFKRKYSSRELNRYLLLDPESLQATQLLNMERVTLSMSKSH